MSSSKVRRRTHLTGLMDDDEPDKGKFISSGFFYRAADVWILED
jgi:hypothetical protein